jgi:hypothetical protein
MGPDFSCLRRKTSPMPLTFEPAAVLSNFLKVILPPNPTLRLAH